MTFNLAEFITAAHAAAKSDEPVRAVRHLMETVFADLPSLRAGLPDMPADSDDVIHFEDEYMTMYQSRFRASIAMPPHDHQMAAIIGLYAGSERNDFYRVADANPNSSDNSDASDASDADANADTFLTLSGGVSLTAGDVAGMGPNAIHTVTVTNGDTSEAIHIYLGSLSAAARHVFDLDNKQILPLTTENFQSLSKFS